MSVLFDYIVNILLSFIPIIVLVITTEWRIFFS